MHAVVKDHACIYYIHNERRVSDIGDLPIRVRMVEGEGILEHSLIKASTSISLFITLGAYSKYSYDCSLLHHQNKTANK